MRRRAALIAATALMVAATPTARSPSPAVQDRPTFRSNADAVTVPVFVRNGGTPIAGLRADHFMLTDNGVPQRVESVENENIPVDVTVLIETGESMIDYMSTINAQVQRILAMVRPTDRVEVLGIDTYVTEILPLRPAAEQPRIAHLPVGRLSSVNDALVAALLRQPDDTRRHLIIAVTDTIDSMSDTTFETVREAARHSTATLEVAWITLNETAPNRWTTSAERARAAACGPALRCEPRSRYLMPHVVPRPGRPWEAFDVLREAAAMTGGEVHPPGVFTDRTAAAIFDKVYNDYRRAYLLRYTAVGVKRDGWHDIKVTVPAYPSYEITARRGYLVEAVKPPTPAPDLRPGSVEALVAAGSKGDDLAVNRVIAEAATQVAFSRLMRDFTEAARSWPGATGEEFLVAFRLAGTALHSMSGFTREEGSSLLRRYAVAARQTSPALEHLWWSATVGLAESTLSGPLIKSLASDAAARFPRDGRFVLAQAIAEDVRWRIGDASIMDAPKAGDIARLAGLYQAAATFPNARDEALVRLGFLLHRLGREPEALEALVAADARAGEAAGAGDTHVRYWRDLFLGHVLDALGRVDEAGAAFRRAMATVPGAQSAEIALMTHLARRGGRDEARQLAERTLSAEPARDPWNEYWGADARLILGLLNELRAYR